MTDPRSDNPDELMGEWRQRIERRLRDILEGRLSPTERDAWTTKDKRRLEAPEILQKFDRVIIDEAATLGPRVFWSPAVLLRIQQWHDQETDGPQLLKQLFRAIERSAQVTRGKDRHPLNAPEYKQLRRDIVREVRTLRNWLRSRVNACRRPLSTDELCGMIRLEIESRPNAYPCLSLNRDSLFGYLLYVQNGDTTERSLIKRFSEGEADISEIVNGWGSWAFSISSPDQYRKIVSALPDE